MRVASDSFKIIGVLWLLISACGDNNEQDALNNQVSAPPEKVTSMSGVSVNQKVTIGDTLQLTISADATTTIDSIVVILGAQRYAAPGNTVAVVTGDYLPGKTTLSAEAYFAGTNEKHALPLELLSDVVPVPYTYQRVTYYTHDPDAFTQGLFYHDGFLYENTGKKGQSSLRKVELETGNILQEAHLPDQYFGEGITLWKDKIIQLTYTSHQGFVYNLDDFEQVGTFTFSSRTGEGWGLTTVGEELVMTDGSEYLFFLDPESLQEKRQMPVYDHQGPIKNLNEVEYIDGVIYANIWQSNDIVTIDPETGKVLTRIDLTGLMNASWNRKLDVLNGIAYDQDNKRLFVTGKWWPRLYEIRLIEQKPS